MKVLILIVLLSCSVVLAKDKKPFNAHEYYFNFRPGDKNITYEDRVSMYHHYLNSKKWNEMREEVALNIWR